MNEELEVQEQERRLMRDTSSRYRAQTRAGGTQIEMISTTKRNNVSQKKYPRMLSLRATKYEYEWPMNGEKEAQLSLSRFLIECGLSKNALTWEEKQQPDRAIVQLARAGNNLNQVAKQLNSQRGVLDYANLDQTLSRVETALKEVGKVRR